MKKIIAILSIALVFTYSCGKERKAVENNRPVISVKVSGISANTNMPYITASGKIEAENSANVSTRLMGFITKVHVNIGQKVTAGQLLVSLSNTDLQAKIGQVDASILQATAGYNNAKKDYDRFVVLFGQQSASQKELDDITSRYEMAKANLEGTKQMRNEVMAQFSYSNITAPFSGEVINTFVKQGDMANPGMPLVSIEGGSSWQVAATVSESDITFLKNNMDVKVLIKSTNQELTGKVSEVSRSSKNTGGQYVVKIKLDTSETKVLSGMFVNVQFPIVNNLQMSTAKLDKVLVPQSALVKQGQLTGIYTIGSEQTAILRWLRLGKSYGDHVEILSGLSSNEEYIVSAEGKLFNGAKVLVN